LEIGPVTERPTGTGASNTGASVAIEYTGLHGKLEFEFGVSRAQRAGATEWQTEFMLKVPITRSEHIELMLGLAPTWTRVSGGGERGDHWGAEGSIDFQYWVSKRWGWFVEPAYSAGFNRDGERTIGVTVGVLLSIR